MNNSFLPGWAHMYPSSRRRLANFCHSSPGHLADQRALAVDHFVMGNRQYKVLGELVPDAEGELVVLVFAEYGFGLEVGQGVMHPSHVPFHAEPEAAQVCWTRHHRPCGRLFGDRLSVRMIPVHTARFKFFRKTHGVEISWPPKRFGIHSPRFAAVIEIQHRGEPHPPAGRRCDTCRARTARCWRGSCAPRRGRS